MNVITLVKKTRKNLGYRAIEAISYFYYFAKPLPSDQIRVLIFGQGRSGSTLLENLICSTGYFRQNGELLSRRRGEILCPIQYIFGLSKLRAPGNFIFHVKVYQLTQTRKRPIDPAEFLNILYGAGWKIIYLRRRNKVRQALSNLVANHRGAYHKYTDEVERFSIKIDCNNFVHRVNERFRFEGVERAALANINYHGVIYEDDLEKPDAHQKTINRILDYVSLEHREATTRNRKVNTQPLKDLIVNYNEFVDCLTEQGWQNFI